MTESQYKSTPGKTILCVFIYIVSGLIASYFIGSLIQFIIYNCLFPQGYLMDDPIVEIIYKIYLLSILISPLIVTHFTRKYLIKTYPSLTASSTTAVLYMSFLYLISIFISLLFIANFFMFALYLGLYFYYLFKTKPTVPVDRDDNDDLSKG